MLFNLSSFDTERLLWGKPPLDRITHEGTLEMEEALVQTDS